MAAISRQQKLLDSFAIGASALCLVHCLLLPALLIVAPALTAFVALPERFHLLMFILAVPMSLLALAAGWRRHRRAEPALIACAGLCLIGAGALLAEGEWLETLLTVPGSLLLALGHAVNWRAMRH
ncbi:MerC domain-containing protein [Sphingomonas sp. BGYR3]|uniref:MerC domain-containing protein n=1 Tax=Sphingomonas sp. BGYR3 TaxID=2975483 RepID=UPI0021A8AD2C|nr:MerC domain-containing protein [Sphingomonas sp. BGYR3]MDG5487258.1 MerC domain-containing protein [Sphingomonas sp. BGYR3]